MRLTAFRNTVDNLIAFNAAAGQPINVRVADIDGVSLSDEFRSGPWRAVGRLDWLDPTDRMTGHQLPRRTKGLASLSVDYTSGAWTYGGRWLASDERFDDTAERVRLGGYALLDLRASRRLSDEWVMSLQLDNAFDRRFETAAFYPQPGRRIFVSLAWTQR